MRKSAGIALPKGKLGVLTVGMGAVATTFMAGVDLVRRKKSLPVGSLTQLGTIRLGKRTESRAPAIKDFVPLEKLENIVFGGWDIFPVSAYEAAKNAAVLSSEHLAEAKAFLSKIRPDEGRIRPELRQKADRHAREKGPQQVRPGHADPRRHLKVSKRKTRFPAPWSSGAARRKFS